MAINSTAAYQETLSLALEERSAGFRDLVSNSNVLLNTLRSKDMWQPYSGPAIRERLLYNETGSGLFYSGYQYLNPVPTELINDAVWTPKMAAVSVVLSNEEILNNSGDNQLEDILDVHISAAEQELLDLVDVALHSDGTGYGGKQFTGLLTAIPTTVNSGTYGGIDRSAVSQWRTTTYDANSAFSGITAVTSTTIRSIINQIIAARSRGRRGFDLGLMSTEHYNALDAAIMAIARVNDENRQAKLGFASMKYIGAGKQIDIVLEGGIGSNMPSNVTYFVDTDNLKFRYHPERNFNKIGKAMTPVNQDAIVQHMGIMGELTMTDPTHQVKLYDSSP